MPARPCGSVNTPHGSSTRTARSATTMGSPATASIQLKQLVYQLHGAEFTVGDLAGAHGFSSLRTHSSAVSGGLISHHTRACGFDAACLCHGSSFGRHFSAGAVRVELQGKLRAIGFISVGTKSGESGNSSNGQETDRKRTDLFMVKLRKILKRGTWVLRDTAQPERQIQPPLVNQPRSLEEIWPVRTASAAWARTAARSAVDL